jgi:hypothetical protein
MNKKILYSTLIILAVIIVIGIVFFINFTTIPSSEGKFVIRHSSGGQNMLIAECADPSYVENTSTFIIEGTVEKVESKWNLEENFIHTYSDFRIENYIKGTPLEEDVIQIITDTGCVGEICQSSEHDPIMTEGRKRLYIVEYDGKYRIHGCGGVKTL